MLALWEFADTCMHSMHPYIHMGSSLNEKGPRLSSQYSTEELIMRTLTGTLFQRTTPHYALNLRP